MKLIHKTKWEWGERGVREEERVGGDGGEGGKGRSAGTGRERDKEKESEKIYGFQTLSSSRFHSNLSTDCPFCPIPIKTFSTFFKL